jgi:hypothetical protein
LQKQGRAFPTYKTAICIYKHHPYAAQKPHRSSGAGFGTMQVGRQGLSLAALVYHLLDLVT